VKYQVQTENIDVVSRPEKPAVAQEEVQPCSRFAVHRDIEESFSKSQGNV
jgi:hypothetical protein